MMFSKALFWLKTAADLGQLYLYSRKPHIEEDLPADIGEGDWMVLATASEMVDAEPIYATPAYRSVRAGERFWVFVAEGEYWLYAVRGAHGQSALREFYAEPSLAVALPSPVRSERGFRADVQQLAEGGA